LQALLYPFRYWNWKTASITASIRGSIFLIALGRHGGQTGALIEIAYVVVTAGFFSAMQQGLLGVTPRWLGRLGIVAGVPVAALTLDCLAHLAARSPNPKSVTLGVLVFSLVSAAFHLHVMESGAMLTGERGRSFVADLKAVPGLLASFVGAPALWIVASIRSGLASLEWETGGAE
jgi:hypothetical protein